MTTRTLTFTKDGDRYQCDVTLTSGRAMVCMNTPHLCRIHAYSIDTGMQPVWLGSDQNSTPSLSINAIAGMKIRIVSEAQPTIAKIYED